MDGPLLQVDKIVVAQTIDHPSEHVEGSPPGGIAGSATEPGVTLFIRVTDVAAAAARVRELGGEVVSGGIVAQTEQVIANLRSVLDTAGCTLADVVKVTCWLDDPRDFSSFNAVFEKHFIDAPPARATVQSALMVDAKVEIEAVAYKPLG